MNITPLQSNFASGEISPLMRNRTDIAAHATALETAINCICTPQGPVFNRFPFDLLHVEQGQIFGSVETMQVSANLFYILLFTNYEVQFFTPSGNTVEAGFVVNPRFASLGENWTELVDSSQSTVTFTRYVCSLNPRNNPNGFAGIRQVVTITDGAAQHKIVIESDVEAALDTLQLSIGTNAGLSDIVDATIGVNDFELIFDPAGATDVYVEVTNSGADGDNQVSVFMVDVIDTVADTPVITPYPQGDAPALYYVENPGGDLIYVLHPSHPPQQVTYNATTGTLSFTPVTFANPPAEWVTGNYPSCGTIHKGRLYLAGTPNEPAQIWASTAGDFVDFLYGPEE
ncbi:MAG: hypothetical protein DRH08_13660, partial [Deltaproteobacteria bacterium]